MVDIKIAPEYLYLAPYFEKLDTLFDDTGITIYKDRNEVKVMEWDGILVNVKRYAIPNVINRVVYTTIRKPKAVRAYNYSFVLDNLGINTHEPIGYRLERKGCVLGFSYLVTLQIPSLNTLYDFGFGSVKDRVAIIKELGRFAAKLHDAEVLHLDFSPGNVLYEVRDKGDIKFTLLDINRMVFGPVSIKQGCKSFERLWGGSEFIELLGESYADAREAEDPELVKRWIRYYHKKYWRHRPSWNL